MKKFSRIYIEITNVCNLSCSFCIGNVRESRFMKVSEFELIVKQVKLYTDHIYLHVLGEPLLHPDLEEILDIAYKENLKVNITTNGTLLGEKQDMLLNSPALRKVSVSLHSMESDSLYSMEEYLDKVVIFAKASSKQGIFCDLRLWNLGDESENKIEIFDILSDILVLDREKKQEVRAKIAETGNVTLAPKIFLGKALRFSWPSMQAQPTDEEMFCYGLRNQVAILCDGTVVPCCLDSCGDIFLGNVFELPLTDILTGDRAKRLYDGFSNRKPSEELCRRCGYATRF